MKCYVILIQDRHVDTDVEVWLEPSKAIDRARYLVGKYARHPEDIEEKPSCEYYLFRINYSCEGDSITVLEREMQ